MEGITTRQDLLRVLKESGIEVGERVRALPASALEAGQHEGEWTGREVLAHVASIEWTYPRLIDLAKLAQSGDAPASAAGFDVNSYNQRQVDKRSGASVEELIDEFDRNRAATIAAVEGCEEALLLLDVESAAGIKGTLAEVLDYVAVKHVRQHIEEIAAPV